MQRAQGSWGKPLKSHRMKSRDKWKQSMLLLEKNNQGHH